MSILSPLNITSYQRNSDLLLFWENVVKYNGHRGLLQTSFMQQSAFFNKSNDAAVHQKLDGFGYILGQI